ncbi:hypothetical protein BIY27_18945 [Gibbsiella quercinecans]|nr:hypothetical protein BIY27_18945 [Gibbsiella quercinecans]
MSVRRSARKTVAAETKMPGQVNGTPLCQPDSVGFHHADALYERIMMFAKLLNRFFLAVR